MWLKSRDNKGEGKMWVKKKKKDRCFYFLEIGESFPLFETVQSTSNHKSDV